MSDTNPLPAAEPASPCVGVCQLDGSVCIGCGRVIGEIARWSSADAATKALIVAAADRRLAIIRASTVPPSAARSAAP